MTQGGALSPRRNHFDLSIRPTIEIATNTGVKSHILRKLDKDLLGELEELLWKCGYGGTFTLFPIGFAKGTSHTKGIRLKEVRKNGVVLHLHGGSNDSNVEAILLRPPEFNELTFYTTLKMTQQKLNQESDDAEEIVSPPMLRLVADASPPSSLPLPEEVEEEELEPAVHITPEASERPLKRFLEDPENMQLFLEEIFKHADDQGRVQRKRLSYVLVREFSFPKIVTGPVIRSLYSRNLLKKEGADDEYLQLVTVPPRVIVSKVEAPTPLPELPPPTEAPKREEPPQQSGSSLASNLARLERLAKTGEKCTSRLAEVEHELEDLTPLIQTLTTRQEALTSEKARLETKLAQPEIRAAQEKFAELTRLLK